MEGIKQISDGHQVLDMLKAVIRYRIWIEGIEQIPAREQFKDMCQGYKILQIFGRY